MDTRLGVNRPGHHLVHRARGSGVEVNKWRMVFWVGLFLGLLLYAWTLIGASNAP